MAEPKEDVFPVTDPGWIQDRLDAGELETLNRHIMRVYYEPLQVYVRGSSARGLGDPADLVAGFFADRLARDGYLAGWNPDERRLRQYLINGFWLYLKERAARARRNRRMGEMPEHVSDILADSADGPEKEFDRAYVKQLVQRALDQARVTCEERGMAPHWQVFIRHLYDELPYKELAGEFGIEPERAAVMCRTAQKHFVRTLHELVQTENRGRWRPTDEVQGLLESIRR